MLFIRRPKTRGVSFGRVQRFLHLSPRELDHLRLSEAGILAQRRLARGVKLNHPEAVALISAQLMERIRDGYDYVSLMELGKRMLGTNQVLPGVASMIGEIQIEATFPDGTKLLTIHGPIASEDGDLSEALKGSFLPVPDLSVFESDNKTPYEKPGQVMPQEGDGIEINKGRSLSVIRVTNTGDRPIQVGSHYHFIETNKQLSFNREAAYGRRLNIPSGTSVRFEPGESKVVTLCDIAGEKNVVSGNLLTNGKASPERLTEVMEEVKKRGFAHDPSQAVSGDPHIISRLNYCALYGPTTGDRVRLADTTLATGADPSEALDTVITNALIIDPMQGVIKADIGIKDGKIVAVGKAGNPDVMEGVTKGMVTGVTTDVIAGEKLIATPGGIDTHVHFICPQLIEEAIASGLTTLYGGGTGPSAGTSATTCTPAPSHIEMMLKATDHIPLNFGFSGKGNTSDPRDLYNTMAAGASGFKLHEDWGTTPASIDACLAFADEYDVAVTIHTDTLNESGFVDDSIGAFKDRTIHTYHTEGAGGGHAPDIIKVCSLPNVIPSSTNPTRPLTINTVDEHLDMLMVCHHLDKNIREDVAFAESRIREETIAAEDILHDMGAISIMSSDSQAMGRVGEVITRTWQTADKMKKQLGALPEDGKDDDNERIKRYVAKYTINPARAHGMSHLVGSIEPGKLADICLWNPARFGAKPEMIIKGGTIAYAQMGDPNASIPTPQPVLMRPMYGNSPKAAEGISIAFVSGEAAASGITQQYGLGKIVEAVKKTRGIGKKDMVHNNALPQLEVDPETFEVRADGKLLTCNPIKTVSLSQRHVQSTMPEITKNVTFDTIAREWRMKWDNKETLSKVQEVLNSVKKELKEVKGVKSVQRVVCGGCLDYKVVVAVDAESFKGWSEDKFVPEEKFLEAVGKISGVSKIECQTFTLMPVEL
ncbi:hypothetical protein AAMO2058_001180700 [Amorphochlora amoebiformis]